MVIVRSSFWSSFWAAFHFRTFEVCSFCAWYLLFLEHSFWMLLEASCCADINLLDECLQIQNQANMCIKSHRFLCHPYRSWEFHDRIKYQCPGVTVTNGRRFWRALISQSKDIPNQWTQHSGEEPKRTTTEKLSLFISWKTTTGQRQWRHEKRADSWKPRHSRISCATRSPTATTKSCGGLKSEDCREHPVNIDRIFTV